MYIMPCRPLAAGTCITVTWMADSVIAMRGVSDVAFSDIELSGSWANGVEGNGTTNVAFCGIEAHGMRRARAGLQAYSVRKDRPSHVLDQAFLEG